MCIIRMPPAPHWSQTSTLFHAANRQQAPVHLNGAEACLGQGGARAMQSPVSCCGTGTPPALLRGTQGWVVLRCWGTGEQFVVGRLLGLGFTEENGFPKHCTADRSNGYRNITPLLRWRSPAPTSLRSLDRWAIGVPCSYRRISLLSQSAYCQLRCLMVIWALKCGICRVGWGARCNVTL